MKQKPSFKPTKPPEKQPDAAPRAASAPQAPSGYSPQGFQKWLESLPKGSKIIGVDLPPDKPTKK